MPKKKRRKKPAPKPPKPEPLGKPTTEQLEKWLNAFPGKHPMQVASELNERLRKCGAPGQFRASFVVGTKLSQVRYHLGEHHYSLAEGLVKLEEFEDAQKGVSR